MTLDNEYRLPRSVVPTHYALTMEPSLDTASFVGHVLIDVDIVEPSDVLMLNAADLAIESAVVWSQGRDIAATVQIDADAERVLLTPESAVGAGPAQIELAFAGELNDQLRGFYRSTFTDSDGNDQVIATTQFESTSARRAFPCFDEPSMKATFSVTFIVDEGLLAVSCTEAVDETILDDGRRRIVFGKTMKIPTYVVAFIVGDLEATDPITVRGTPLRVIHVPGKAELATFALEAGAFAMGWLADYYDIEMPPTKVDLIAVPDFAFGAMENQGCLTFRESLLLTDPSSATITELSRVADVIAHEVAHMWFGNLVTMDWWEGIWLKEAFATFMETAAVDAFRPEWKRWEQFSRERAGAFAVDSLVATRAIEYPVHSPADAEAMFDVITYEKGAAVVRMLEQHLGADVFRDGVRHYLKKFSFGNTSTTDLWDALEESSGAPVRSTMDSWIFQGGHPVIDVSATATGVDVRQTIFRFDGSGEALWSVPLAIRARVDGSIVEQSFLLDAESAQIDLGGRPDWVVANAGAHGFFRVRYEPSLATTLIGQAQEILSVTERVALVADLIAAVTAGIEPAEAIMLLAEEFSYETDLSVWRALAPGLGLVHQVVSLEGSAEQKAAVERRIGRVTSPALDILGIEAADGEDTQTTELRGLLLELSGTLGGDERAVALARKIVDAASDDVDPEMMAAAISIVAHHGTDADRATYVERFRSAATPQDELRYLTNLASFPDRHQMDATLELCRTEVRSQNAPFVLAACLRNQDHGAHAWKFITAHWDELVDRFPNNSIPRMVGGVQSLTDEAVAADVDQFIAAHPIPQGGAMIDQALERMHVNVALRAREAQRLPAAIAG